MLRRYRDLNVVEFETLRATGQAFLLLTRFGALTWWPTRPLEEQYTLTVVSRSGRHAIYRVNPPTPTASPAAFPPAPGPASM